MNKQWIRVEMAELEELWDARRKAGAMTDGCTHADLQAKYGADNVRHTMGVGWFKRVATSSRITINTEAGATIIIGGWEGAS